jgi:hypothetical protein
MEPNKVLPGTKQDHQRVLLWGQQNNPFRFWIAPLRELCCCIVCVACAAGYKRKGFFKIIFLQI